MIKTERGPWSDRLDDEKRGIVEGLELALGYFEPGQECYRALTAAIDRLKRPEGWPKGAPLPEFVPQKGERVVNAVGRLFVVADGTPIVDHGNWRLRAKCGRAPSVDTLRPAPETRTVTLKISDPTLTDEQITARFAGMDVEVGR